MNIEELTYFDVLPLHMLNGKYHKEDNKLILQNGDKLTSKENPMNIPDGLEFTFHVLTESDTDTNKVYWCAGLIGEGTKVYVIAAGELE